MLNLTSIFIPCSLFLISFLLRLSLISKGAYHADCLYFATIIEKTLETGHLHFLHSHGYPLSAILGAVFFGFLKLFSVGDPVFAVNFMSVFFSSLCIPLIYLVTNRFFEQRHLPGLFAAVLLMVSPVFLGNSVYGNTHTPGAFFLLCTLLFILKYLETHRVFFLLASGLFLGLLGAARLQDYVALILPVSVFLLFYDTQRGFRHRISACGVCLLLSAGTVFLFYIPLLLEPAARADQLSLLTTFESYVLRYLSGELLFLYKRSLHFFLLNLSWFGIVCFLGGLATLLSQPRRLIVLLVWILVPLFVYGALANIIGRFLIPSFLAVYLVMGHFFSYLCSLNRSMRYFFFILFIILAGINYQYIFPRVYFRHQHSMLPDYARWVGEHTHDNARIVMGDDWQFMEYYGQRKTIIRPLTVAPPIPAAELETFRQTLDALLEEGTPVYITDKGVFNYNQNHQFSNFLFAHYVLEYIGENQMEDWHVGTLAVKIDTDVLFRFRKKE